MNLANNLDVFKGGNSLDDLEYLADKELGKFIFV